MERMARVRGEVEQVPQEDRGTCGGCGLWTAAIFKQAFGQAVALGRAAGRRPQHRRGHRVPAPNLGAAFAF